MSYSQNSGRRAEKNGNPVSLFPFLAVLLCTMGALIAVLLIIARQAQISADEMVEEMLAETKTEMEIEPETVSEERFNLSIPEDSELPSNAEIAQRIHDLKNLNDQKKWRLDELKKVREQAEKEAQEARIALSTTQENRNRRLGELENFREALLRLQSQSEKMDVETILAEIEKKKAEEERLLKELEQAENTAKKRDGSYAILPYDGANGTRRYPIYIECREDGAWLMPENIQLATRDFEGALSMENPLEMALMTKRQYLLRNGVFQETHDNAQEPYPLIIVRPGGIMYLYMVRSALQSWKSEFGYELIEDNLPVAYPPNDENLKREMNVAIQRGRERQREIAAMAPTLPHTTGGGRGGVVYHPTSQGGVAMSVDKDSRLARTLQRSAPRPVSHSGAYGANGNVSSDINGNDSQNPNYPVSQNIADQEGQNWALENYQPNLTSLTRPLPMECYADRFVLSGTPGFDQVIIPISTPIPTVKRLAKEIGGKIKGWGDAGRGAYWKPILRVRVSPDARDQFALLQEMLRGSGLIVEEVK